MPSVAGFYTPDKCARNPKSFRGEYGGAGPYEPELDERASRGMLILLELLIGLY